MPRSKTLLQIVQTCQQELGLPVSLTVAGNADATTVQMFAFLNATLDELREYNDEGWTALQSEFNLAVTPPVTTLGTVTQNSRVITNIASVSGLGITPLNFNSWAISAANIPPASRIASIDNNNQITMTMEATGTSTDPSTSIFSENVYDMFGNIVYDMFGDPILTSPITHTFLGEEIQFGQDTYAMPDDFDFYQNATWWDRTNHWALIGPDSPQIDQWHRSGIVATGPRRHFRNIGPYDNTFRLWPPPFELVNPIQATFEYMSLFAVQAATGTYSFKQYFTLDTDTCLLNDRALIMGVKWRFWEQKGMNWGSKRSDYDQWVDRLVARDGGAQTLALARNGNSILISPFSVQDGNYPAPTWTI